MTGSRNRLRLRPLSVALLLAGFVPVSPAFATDPSPCRDLATKLDQIKPQITSVETNQALFASAANGCNCLLYTSPSPRD